MIRRRIGSEAIPTTLEQMVDVQARTVTQANMALANAYDEIEQLRKEVDKLHTDIAYIYTQIPPPP